MCKIPRISGKDAVAAFEKAGFCVVRVRGSHHILKKLEHRYRLSVPVHSGKTIGKGLLSDLIDKAGLTVPQFLELL